MHFQKQVPSYIYILCQDENYAHLEADAMKNVQKTLEEKFKWFNEKMLANAKCPTHVTPSVYPSQVLSEKKASIYESSLTGCRVTVEDKDRIMLSCHFVIMFILSFQLLEDFCNPIVNKPKPKVEPPKEEPPKDDAHKTNSEQPKADSEPSKEDAPATQETPTENMETDKKEEQSTKSNLDMEVD